MKVGDGQQNQRADNEDRKEKKRREETRREKERDFSKLLDRRQKGGNAGRCGDERTRRLREGRVQKREREREGRRSEQRDGKRKTESRHDEQRTRRGGDKTKESENKRTDGEREASVRDESSNGRDDGASVAVTGRNAGGEGSGREIEAVRERIEESGRASVVEESSRRNEAIDEVARRIVDAIRVGEDDQRRQVVFLDVTVPGRGEVRIRLRRDGGGMEVRMRADNDSLARSLQEGADDLHEKGRDEGIEFTSIRVVR